MQKQWWWGWWWWQPVGDSQRPFNVKYSERLNTAMRVCVLVCSLTCLLYNLYIDQQSGRQSARSSVSGLSLLTSPLPKVSLQLCCRYLMMLFIDAPLCHILPSLVPCHWYRRWENWNCKWWQNFGDGCWHINTLTSGVHSDTSKLCHHLCTLIWQLKKSVDKTRKHVTAEW